MQPPKPPMDRKSRPAGSQSIRTYFSRVVFQRQLVLFFVILVLVGMGSALNIRVFLDQLSRQTEDMAWQMEEFMRDSQDLLHLLGTFTKQDTDLGQVIKEYPYFEALYLISPDKKLVSLAPADPRYFGGMDMSGRFLAPPGREAVLSSFFRSEKTDRPCMEASTLLPGGGWLNIQVNLERIQEVLSHFRLGTFGIAYICDDQGSFLVYPDFSRVRIHDYIFPGIQLRKSTQGQIIFTAGSFSMVYVSRLQNLQAWLVVQVDVMDLLKPYLFSMAGIMILVTLFSFLLVFNQRKLINTDLRNPVLSLDSMAQTIAQGKLDLPENQAHSPILELENLSQAFLSMARNLAKQRESLEETLHNLQARSQEMQSFTYAVSHDLRSPLVTIRGFLSFLPGSFARGDEVAFKEDVDRISSAALTMEAHLQDILSLSRIGYVEAKPSLEDLGDCARAAVELLDAAWREVGTTPRIDPGLPVLWVHRHQMIELFQNLFENAWKYRDPSRPLEIHLAFDAEGWIEIRDNGIGFPPEQGERIFRLFERLNPGVPGNGLGLAVVRRILDTHRGEVHAYSEGPGKGAVFRFRLKGFEPVPDSKGDEPA